MTVALHILVPEGADEPVRFDCAHVRRAPLQCGEIGHRIGGRHDGRGYATRAVVLADREAVGAFGLDRLEAATSPWNTGSQAVPLRNGFGVFGPERGSFRVHGIRHDSARFERIEGGAPLAPPGASDARFRVGLGRVGLPGSAPPTTRRRARLHVGRLPSRRRPPRPCRPERSSARRNALGSPGDPRGGGDPAADAVSDAPFQLRRTPLVWLNE